ncbi:MAG: ThuA domain-containing protein [Planctomycetota bacterium JB042]
MRALQPLLGLALSTPLFASDDAPGVTYEGADGPGRGKHLVFVTGDEEYRSEEAMPQLARILAVRHGFRCTVLFSIDEGGAIDPEARGNLPGLEALDDADLMVIFTRFRDLPDEQMAPLVRYVESGRPIVGFRTATHAFDVKGSPTYARYSWRSEEWDGGFGRHVLGETWIAHHGAHGSQSTRGIVVAERAEHPILRGIEDGDVWDPTDVYAVRLPLPDGIEPLLLGEVVDGMAPDDPPLAPRVDDEGRVTDKNDPMMPVAWVREWTSPSGAAARVFTTTTGTSRALLREGTRRLYVNACLWAVGLEDAIRPDLDVDLVGPFEPSAFGFGGQRRGVRPAALRLEGDAASSEERR